MKKSTTTFSVLPKKHPLLLTLLAVFLFAFIIRIWIAGGMGRTVDEEEAATEGYKLIQLALEKNFSDEYWWKHSPDHPPLTKYIRGIITRPDISGFENGIPNFRYDFPFTRFFSVLLTSITAVIVGYIGYRFVSPFVGFAAGIIFSLLPPILGHSQSIMWEPYILFFFTATIASYLVFLFHPSKKLTLLTGILLGLSVLVKETNLLLPPLMLLLYVVWKLFHRKKKEEYRFIKLLLIYLISFATFFLLWPMPFFHLDYIFAFTQKMRFSNPLPVPEVFFGRLLLVPKTYYLVYLLITTPLIILFFLFVGIKNIALKRTWILLCILFWFLFPFLQSLYPMRQQGLRYIIEIYAPLSIIAAIGLEGFLSLFAEGKQKIIVAVIFLVSLMPILRISPYYYDYFNILVGGTKHVYETQSFQQGWWGQGTKEAGEYLKKHAKKGETIGVAISPSNNVMPQIEKASVRAYNPSETYDYIVLNHYNIIREGFDDSAIKKQYKLVYSVDADGAKLVYVYKRR